MDKSLRRVSSQEQEEVKAETYRYWHSRPDAEVFAAIAELSQQAYAEYYKLKGGVPHDDRPARSLTRIQRIPR